MNSEDLIKGRLGVMTVDDKGVHSPQQTRQGIGRRYALAAFNSGVAGSVSLVFYGLAQMILARHLGPEGYGKYAVVMALASLVAGLFQMGQHSALHKMLPECAGNDRNRGGAILADLLILTIGLLLAFCALFWVSAGWIAAWLYRDGSLAGVLRFSTFLILTMTLFNLAASVVAGLQEFRVYNTAVLTRSITFVSLAWVGAAVFGLMGALTGQLLALLMGLILLARCAVKLARNRFPGLIRPDFSRKLLRSIGAFVLPAFLLTLLNLPVYWWINTLIARHHGFAEAGLFCVAYSLAQVIWLVPVNLYVPAMTFLSEAHAARDRQLFERLVNHNLRAIWLLTLPMSVGGALLSPLLLRLILGAIYQEAMTTALILSLTALPMALVGLSNTVMAAAGRIWSSVAITFLWTIVLSVTGWTTIPRWGAAGGAIALGASYILYLSVLCGYLSLVLRVSCHAAGRMALLTLTGFSLTVLLMLTWTGLALWFASALLLVCLVTAEWRWVCGNLEREALGKGLAFLRLATIRS